MKYCKTCNVTYNSPLHNCMFCNNPLEQENEEQEVNYFPPITKQPKAKKFVIKLLAFLFIITNITCLFLDITDDKTGTQLSWSLYVFSATLYALLLLLLLLRKCSIIKKLNMIFFLTILELLAIGIVSETYHWATDYILPFGIILSTMTMTSFLFGKRTKLYDNTIYVILASALFIFPLLLLLLGITKTTWPSIACIFYCIITLLSLFYFRTEEIKNELQRRLHF